MQFCPVGAVRDRSGKSQCGAYSVPTWATQQKKHAVGNPNDSLLDPIFMILGSHLETQTLQKPKRGHVGSAEPTVKHFVPACILLILGLLKFSRRSSVPPQQKIHSGVWPKR